MYSCPVRCPVLFDGLNYREWTQYMRIHMSALNLNALNLWKILNGEHPCPAHPTPPVDTDTYQRELTAYQSWIEADARATTILVASIEVSVTGDIIHLSSAQLMWIYLRDRYATSSNALFLTVVRREHLLQQNDATVDEFYAQLSAVWCQLNSLGPQICRTCQCCQNQRSHLEYIRLHSFLTRLRVEFEPIRAQLLARHPRVTLLEALSDVRNEETRLRSAGLLPTSALAAHPPSSTRRAPPVSVTPFSFGGERPGADILVLTFCFALVVALPFFALVAALPFLPEETRLKNRLLLNLLCITLSLAFSSVFLANMISDRSLDTARAFLVTGILCGVTAFFMTLSIPLSLPFTCAIWFVFVSTITVIVVVYLKYPPPPSTSKDEL